MTPEEIKADIYRMFDKVSLTGGNLLSSKKNMTQIVTELRSRLADELALYITIKIKEANESETQ